MSHIHEHTSLLLWKSQISQFKREYFTKYKVLIRLDHKVLCKSWIWPDFDTVALVLHCSALSENNMTLYILSLDVWWQKE